MTAEVEQSILAKLEGEPTCPHGNPIPGTEGSISWSELKPVSTMEAGDRGTLRRLLEDIELDHDVMLYLEQQQLMPGAEIIVVDVAPDGTRTLQVGEGKVAVGQTLQNNLWVLPAA